MYSVFYFGGNVTYDMRLGILATEAVAELLQAKSSHDLRRYEAFLAKTLDFCGSIRQSSPQPTALVVASPEAREFFSALLSGAKSQRPVMTPDLDARVTDVEELVRLILSENRHPNRDEELKIAEMLYLASAANLSEH